MVIKFKIHPVPPYDFELSTKIFFSDEYIRKFENNKYKQLITINELPILIELKSVGTVNEPELELILKSNKEISKQDSQLALETVNKIFNLDFNLLLFYKDIKRDKVMSKLAQNLYGLKNPIAASVFEAMVLTIIEQQISLKAAHSIERKMIKKFGSTLKKGTHVYYAFPTPKQLNDASFDELRECGLTLRKTEYVKSISKEIENRNLDLEKFKQYKDSDKIINELCKIRGIGLWTAEFVMLRGLNRLDSIPADDIGIRRVISHYYCNGKNISSDEVHKYFVFGTSKNEVFAVQETEFPSTLKLKVSTARKIAENWGKWKGLASFYLIIAEMMNIII